jgi:hypothetical protein
MLSESKNPEVLLVTPLLTGHEISRETKISLKRNDVNFYWLSSMGENNIPTNALEGIHWYKNKYGTLPTYYMMLDRDVTLGRHCVDKLLEALARQPQKYGYSYSTFEFAGHIKQKFPAYPFDLDRLINGNYISSNSLFRSEVIEKVGLVTDDKYKRLLDYAFLLKCYAHGYIGKNVPNANFTVQSTANDISAGNSDDYNIKYQRVYEDFIKPLNVSMIKQAMDNKHNKNSSTSSSSN